MSDICTTRDAHLKRLHLKMGVNRPVHLYLQLAGKLTIAASKSPGEDMENMTRKEDEQDIR